MHKNDHRNIPALVTIGLILIAAILACGTTSQVSQLNVETQVALTLASVGGNVPATQQPPSANNVEFNGISFTLNPTIASGVSTQVIPAVGEGQGAPWEVAPQTEQIDFTGYVTGKKFHDPRIMIYPVADFSALDEHVASVIATLQQDLANKPNLPAGNLPFLPAWNAAQLFNLMPAFVSFQNGVGIRYLTEYGQYSAPVNNTDLFYTFQGLTSDGKYYISVLLPVTHPSLPPDSMVEASLQNQIMADYQAYLASLLPNLAAQPLNSFTPDISALDAMIQSLKVH